MNGVCVPVSCHNKVPAVGQWPLLSAPDHSRWGVTFSLAVELCRLPDSHRHILWLQHQHRLGCSRREEELTVLCGTWVYFCRGGCFACQVKNRLISKHILLK